MCPKITEYKISYDGLWRLHNAQGMDVCYYRSMIDCTYNVLWNGNVVISCTCIIIYNLYMMYNVNMKCSDED